MFSNFLCFLGLHNNREEEIWSPSFKARYVENVEFVRHCRNCGRKEVIEFDYGTEENPKEELRQYVVFENLCVTDS